MIKSLMVAYGKEYVMGYKNALPWHLPSDLAHFRAKTVGKAIIMGRKTHQSIGRSLKNRCNIVLSRSEDFCPFPGAVHKNNLSSAFAYAEEKGYKEAIVIGGAGLYKEAFPLVDVLYITEISATFKGDVFFPHWERSKWNLIDQKKILASDKNPFTHTFFCFTRSG